MVDTFSEGRIGRDVTPKSKWGIDVGIEIIERRVSRGRCIPGCGNCRRLKEGWQWRDAGIERALRVATELHWQLQPPRAKIAYFYSSIVVYLLLHTQGPSKNLG